MVFILIWESMVRRLLVGVSYSVQMRENTDQKNSEYGPFSRNKRVFKTLPNIFDRTSLQKYLMAFNT